jgi:hypothetical protein
MPFLTVWHQGGGVVPPPTGGGSPDVFHLGTKESTGVTSVPTIGGWQSWSILFPLFWLGSHL